MRVIDADRLQKQFDKKSTNPNYRVNMHNIKSIINNASTVEAIPKAEYEARLKADMVAMLDKIRAEIKGMTPTYHNPDWSITDLVLIPINEVFKLLDKYKAETEAEDGRNKH